MARPHTALKVPPGVKPPPTAGGKPDGVTGFGARPPTGAPRPLTSATRPGTGVGGVGGGARKPPPPPTAGGGKAAADIDIVGYTGEPGEQIKPMVLNLDNLEDSTVEVLLHELHKVEEEEEEEEEEEAAAAATGEQGEEEAEGVLAAVEEGEEEDTAAAE